MTESFHSETKVPGGKLVVVDIDTDGDVITNAKISGDFSLNPTRPLTLWGQLCRARPPTTTLLR